MSTPGLIIDENTKRQQNAASNSTHSAWVSANAGSGKTYVLTQRVVRLLLAGTDPSRILCLTFTKAAAGEMSNRIFQTLGGWAALSNKELTSELETIEGVSPNAAQLRHARTLFARALETLGGLKIQTIHAFCEALLHQFPLEANVPGHFTVMEENIQGELVEQARRRVVLEVDRQPEARIGRAYARMLNIATDAAIEKVMDEIVKRRDTLADWLAETGGPAAAEEIARAHFQFSPHASSQELMDEVVADTLFDPEMLVAIATAGRAGSGKRDQTLAERIDSFVGARGAAKRFENLCAIFLTSGKPRTFSNFASTEIKELFPDLEDRLEQEANRLLKATGQINTLRLIEDSTAVFEIAEAVIERYRLAKRQRGLLDYDDLINRAADLLGRSSARAWVLYKLDLGIDHILLDEAQDTSPRQWDVVRELVEEFFVGESARATKRTVFAVGDEKQSIYSFQGARPEGFVRQRREFERKAAAADMPFKTANLALSFRSTTDVLDAVDAVFSMPQNAGGIVFDDGYQRHTAARHEAPGQVEVWPLVPAEGVDDPQHWPTPVDPAEARHQAVVLAEKVAACLDDWFASGEKIEALDRPIMPEDILILVRSRDIFVPALTRALKDRNIPVAGVDRLALTDHIAVQDLMALGQVVLTPDDDLSLAAVLKSPLFGLNEDDLFTLARARLGGEQESSLFQALKAAAEHEEGVFTSQYQRLVCLLDRADIMPVYEFYAYILSTDGGRRAFVARLGAEVEDVLDAFLDRTLAHEKGSLPGLQAFLEALQTEAPEIKREMDQSAAQVRIMTVHAAKGLEAPVVFLVDKNSPAFQERHAPALYEWSDDQKAKQGFLWVSTKDRHGDATQPAWHEEKRLAEDEHRRLLYVAMTRAKDRLVVCGYCGKPSKEGKLSLREPHWHSMVSRALENDWTEMRDSDGNLLRHIWRSPNRVRSNITRERQEQASRKNLDSLPGWLHHRLPHERALPRPLNPSGAQALIDESLAQERTIPSLLQGIEAEDIVHPVSPRKRGTVVHRLLQMLPDIDPSNRWQLAHDHVTKALAGLSEDACTQLVSDVRSVLEARELAPWFEPSTSRAEVPVMGKLDFESGPRSISGTIDRMAVLNDSVVLLDYKTGSHVPETPDEIPPDYVTQMALYRALVGRIYPDKTVVAVLIWTHRTGGPEIMQLADSALDGAFAAITSH